MVWLRDRLEAFLVQIQGSALQLTDGSRMSVGFAGKTKYPYTSIGRELAKTEALRWADAPVFQPVSAELVTICHNRGFVFFETYGAPAIGCLGAGDGRRCNR